MSTNLHLLGARTCLTRDLSLPTEEAAANGLGDRAGETPPAVDTCRTDVAGMTLGAGGSYLLCDTDPTLIVATPEGGSSLAPVGASPSSTATPGSRSSLDPRTRGVQLRPGRPRATPAIEATPSPLHDTSSTTSTRTGRPLLRKWSEHGLGDLLNPLDPDSDTATSPARSGSRSSTTPSGKGAGARRRKALLEPKARSFLNRVRKFDSCRVRTIFKVRR
jgi:hypothetical protein